MKASFTTLGCPDWSLEQIATNAAAYGYDGVELRTHGDGNHLSPDVSAEEARKVAEMFRQKGAPVMCVMGYARYAFVNDADVAANQELMRKLINVAANMGAKYIRTFAGRIPQGADPEEMVQKVGKALKPLAAEAARRKVTIGLETHDDWCAGERVVRLAKIIDSKKGFGIIYDIFNSIHSGLEPWEVTYKKVRPYVVYCHLKDAYKQPDGKLSYVPLGAGDLPLLPILKKFKKDGYKSYFSFEWEKKWHPELEPPERVFPIFPRKLKAVWKDA